MTASALRQASSISLATSRLDSCHSHHRPPHCPPVSQSNRTRAATMGITDFFTDVWETFAHPSPDAEAPVQGGTSTNSPLSGTDEESGEEAEVNKQDEKSDEGSG